jgi:hypothetical protein
MYHQQSCSGGIKPVECVFSAHVMFFLFICLTDPYWRSFTVGSGNLDAKYCFWLTD